MKKSIYFFLFAVIFILLSCGGSKQNNDPLTSQKIEAYLKSYTELREKAPGMLKEANSGNADKQKQGFGEFESVIKNNGLTFKEYVKINAKVGAVYSVLQGEDFMNQMGKMKNEGMGQIDDAQKQIQKQIDDPAVPEEAKKELRKALEEMKANQEIINTEYDKNKGWADLVMSKTKSMTNMFISKEDAELVKQNMDKITEAYTGGMAPSNFNVNEKE